MISVFGSQVGEKEIENVAACMREQWMGFGKKVDEFENKYEDKFGVPLVMVDSGSNALYMAVTLLNLKPGSEIILPSYTWVACASSIIMAGHKPIFCDVDIKTMNVRKEDVAAKITKNTGAIMVVHYAGLPVEMDDILSLGFPVIEDAAHAVDSVYRNKPCGTIGDVGIFSYDAVKNFTVGEGGGLTAQAPENIARAKTLRYCGIGKSGFDSAISDAGERGRWWEYNIQEPYIKMLPTNLSAAIGLGQLEVIDALQSRRKIIWDNYQRELSDIPELVLPVEAKNGDRHSYFTYCIRGERRDSLAHYLLDNKIYTTLRYHPLHLNPIYNQLSESLPNTEQLNKDALSIPIHPRLTDSDQSKVITEIRKFYKG